MIGMVAAQWVSLLANVLLVFVLAKLMSSEYQRRGMHREGCGILRTFAVSFLTRAAAYPAGSGSSYLASANVKHGLRSLVYEKLMRVERLTAKRSRPLRRYQFSTEGVEQLEIYFGKYSRGFLPVC